MRGGVTFGAIWFGLYLRKIISKLSSTLVLDP